jgi:hypothetical protein
MERGIVLSPKFITLPTGNVLFKAATDNLELRKYLLYWDKIDVPKSSFIEFDCWQFQHLEQTGFLQRTPYGAPKQFTGVSMRNSSKCHIGGSFTAEIIDCTDITLDKSAGDQILSAHDDVYMLRNAQEPGQWSKAQISTKLMASNPLMRESIEIELYNMLPVPTADTPFDDIIGFKEKRNDELAAFRCYLDGLYQSIINASDIPRARITEMIRLEQAIHDVKKTMKESRINVQIDSLRTLMSATGTSIALGLATGTPIVATAFGTSPLISGLVGAAIGFTPALIPQSVNAKPNELTYLKSAYKNLKVQ